MLKNSLNFTELSKYAQSMVVDPTYKISRYVRGISIEVRKEWRIIMLLHEMDLSCLIVYA